MGLFTVLVGLMALDLVGTVVIGGLVMAGDSLGRKNGKR